MPTELEKLNKLLKEEEILLKSQRAKMYAKGLTHLVVAWVHPLQGDDYAIDIFQNIRIDDATVLKHLKKSIIKTDFVRYTINADGTLNEAK